MSHPETDPNMLETASSTGGTDTMREDADSIEISPGDQQEIKKLARRLTESSTKDWPHGSTPNPFTGVDDPTLDPNSPKFSPKHWAKAVIQLTSQDRDRYPERTAGVSFRDLSVYGYGSAVGYQKDILNVVLQAADRVGSLINHKDQELQILRDHDGLLRSGEMLLVLGRPGSGVSTFLKTIAGQTKGLHLGSATEFNYQGIPWSEMHKQFRGDVVYQAETDVNFPHLTVGQTLKYAALAKTPRNRLPGVSRECYATHLRDVVMAVFGISHTLNTKVGDDFVRGVSGGERKRVSIAEVALTQSCIQCWDNSTRGLDSATALEFVRTVRLSVGMAGTAAIVALYQASQQSYDAFDKVAVLYEGRQIYFGPIDHAKQYFIDMGYHCPDRQTTADFLTSLTNPVERVVQPGWEARVPRTPDEFATAWKQSQLRNELLKEIAVFDQEYPIGGPELEKFQVSRNAEKSRWITANSPYTISILQQIMLCLRRGYRRILGDTTFFWATVIGNFILSLVLGSVFYDLADSTSSFTDRCTLLFFAVLFNALNSALEILALYAQRPIVEKHTAYAFYHPMAEAVASMICDLPCKIISTLSFNIPLYYMANLRRDSGHVVIYLLFAFMSTLTMSMIFRSIAQLTRTVPQALTPIALGVIGLVVYTGFVLPTRNMQDWLRWLNYLNPIAYSYETLVSNEFHDRYFPCASFVPSGPSYENVPSADKTCSVAGTSASSDLVSGDAYIAANYEYYYSDTWRNFGILIAFIVFFMTTYLLIAEFILFDSSKGEVLVFQRKHKAALRGRDTANDEESGAEKAMAGESRSSAGHHEGSSGEKTLGFQFQSNKLHWRDVCYDVPIKGEIRRISDHIDGWVTPGTLTALMGASGAGKTTLLDLLASRVKTGVVSGNIYVNGIPRDPSFQRRVGYCQQSDNHLETSTIREALQFSALLRQSSSVSKAEKLQYVEEVIDLLEMRSYADAVVGVPGEGLNVEQRKRLTIGVELAAKPDLLLFLDEPTSGLDSQTAWSISLLLRKLSDHGQAILCTIHQPSAILFQQFDQLLLLARGGRTVYFGPIGENSRTLTGYFERHGARPCADDENPAEWMLEVIGAAPGSVAACDWPVTWKESPEYQEVRQELERLEKSGSSESRPETGSTQQYAAPFSDQLWLCTMRVFQQYWRSPSYIYAKLILCFGAALFIGLSFLNTKITVLGLQHQTFAIFMLLIIFVFLAYQTMPNFIKQRDLYEVRERPAKTYAWSAFMLANIMADIPWNSLAAVLIFLPFYYIIGMNHNAQETHEQTERSGLMFLLVWSFMMHCGTFTMMMVSSVATAEVGATLALLLFAMNLIFCGVMVSPSSLPGFWIFMYRVSPLTYLIGGMLSTGLANAKVTCADIELIEIQPPSNETCGSYLADYIKIAGGAVYNPEATSNCEFCEMTDSNVYLAELSSYYSERWRNFGLMWAYIAFNVFAALFLYWFVRVRSSDAGIIRRLAKLFSSKKEGSQ
ncbi:ATP-binding cassette transporter [Aspergillus heteromorphus CBS 117.55]|uniref:ATP-binding cassette transporter n=1 Tax=Aspergillus heteromorphus CBS 117.55 TaxID=1448321 RepID=A0A317WNY5_9EURO|nr:ATP-binding cassette transporter [Aspergillus heteromorphus CBS 117.55]PWY86648.1 ATP-binding cassette transporter [Aspergillus heteromorphus CBS 117.55]